MHPLKPSRHLAVVLLVLAFCVPALSASPRVVAVGDVHADLDAFISILQRAGLIDEASTWIGGDATLVQTGDFLDRGPRFRAVMDFLMDLQENADRQGGRVIVLLGNHEAMNLFGDLRYVTPENFADFADGKSEKRRRSAWKAQVQMEKRRAAALGKPRPDTGPTAESEWNEKHPLGYFAQREAMSRDGKYGSWLRRLPAIAQVGDTIFVHGGIHPELPSLGVEAIRERITSEIAWFDDLRGYLVQQGLALPFYDLPELEAAASAALEQARAAAANGDQPVVDVTTLENFLGYRSWYAVSGDGPLWFRGFARWSDEEGAEQVAGLLKAFDARRFVVGHSVMKEGNIRTRFDGGVFLIDTGMLASYYEGGRASALDIRDPEIAAIYPDERVVLWGAPSEGTQSGGVPQAAKRAVMAAGRVSLAVRDRTAAPVQLRGPVRATLAAPQETEDAGSQAAAAEATEPAAGEKGFTWIGPDGKALPFRSEEELVEFLRTAEIVAKERIKSGINQPWKVMLEKDGIRMRGVFRDVEMEQRMANVGGRREMGFRDSYIMEPAAYQLGRLLGLDNIPPAIFRKMGPTPGSLQAWVENVMTEKDREEKQIQPPDYLSYSRQKIGILVFDNLIYNTDRNPGNTLIDPDWKLWAIDHTRAFRREREIHTPPGFAQCPRDLLERIKALDPAETEAALAEYLRPAEIKAIFQRREKLLAYVQQLIDKLGEDRVLY